VLLPPEFNALLSRDAFRERPGWAEMVALLLISIALVPNSGR
jgi:hypothetical protein